MDRTLRPYIHKADYEDLIERILKLGEETDPDGGEKTAKGKTLKAREAISAYRVLGHVLLRWAFDHELGIALAGLESYRPPIRGHESDLKNEDLRIKVDTHNHEIKCDAYQLQLEAPLARMNPARARRVAIQMVRMSPVYDPEFIEALRALDFGEVPPLFRPTAAGKHGQNPYKLWQCRLDAVCHLAFLTGYGHGRAEALTMTAGAYGVSGDTVEAWEKRLPQELGDFNVHARRTWARGKGKQIAAINRKLRPTEIDKGVKETALVQFGQDALVRDGKKYLALLRREEHKDRRS